jgi:hypothetical protein
MTCPYLDRYLAGQREAVWDELIGLGDRVQRGPLLLDARAVCREVVGRARYNIELLFNRLVKLGYQFADPKSAFVPAAPNAAQKIGEIERRLGTLPVVVKAWYESMASVDFSQAKEQLQGPTGPDINGLGSHVELVMQSLDRCWESWLAICKEDEDHRQMMAQIKKENPAVYRTYPENARNPRPRDPFLPTGGAASNCDMKGFCLPSKSIDGVLYSDGEEMSLVKMMRRCFEWGGFPFCKYYAAGNAPLPWEARPNIEKLIPLLREGLVAV